MSSPSSPRRRLVAGLAACLLATATLAEPAPAAPVDQVRTLYERFVTAQNQRNLAAVRDVLLDSRQFLWVSDGRSLWGPDAVIERMSLFQEAPVWHVVPDLEKAVAVPVSPGSAYLHLPLLLEIGNATTPDRLRFLVSVLGVETAAGWRIAALFTTEDKSQQP